MAGFQPDDDKDSKITGAGCILVVIDLAVLFGVALPVVRWRDPASGLPLPKIVAIFIPFLIVAVFNGIAMVGLKLLGIPVLRGPDKTSDRAQKSNKTWLLSESERNYRVTSYPDDDNGSTAQDKPREC
jgi:hypothetical protein